MRLQSFKYFRLISGFCRYFQLISANKPFALVKLTVRGTIFRGIFVVVKHHMSLSKSTPSEIRICDQYNRLICTHRRSYNDFPLYITTDEHMPPEHLYYQEINSKDGNYYRRWASVFGPSMSELIDRILKSSKHEEQAFNACAGILHRVKAIPKGIAEEAARKCIEMNSCRYSTYRQVLKKMECDEHPESSPESLPSHENIRGKDYYK